MAGYYEEWERRDAVAAQRKFFMIVGLVIGIGFIVRETMEEPPQSFSIGLLTFDVGSELDALKGHIEDLQFFEDHLDHIVAVGQNDPEEALRQRLPMARCRASVLAPDCDAFGMLFAPDILVPSKRPEMWFDRKEPGDQS